jgi:hypothetical protein
MKITGLKVYLPRPMQKNTKTRWPWAATVHHDIAKPFSISSDGKRILIMLGPHNTVVTVHGQQTLPPAETSNPSFERVLHNPTAFCSRS